MSRADIGPARQRFTPDDCEHGDCLRVPSGRGAHPVSFLAWSMRGTCASRPLRMSVYGHVHARRNDDHDAFSLPASCRFRSTGLLPPAQRHAVHPPVRSLSSRPAAARERAEQRAPGTSFAAPSASATVASCGIFRAVRPNWTRQRKSRLVAMPWRRQTSATAAPGFSVSRIIARFCSSLKRRRLTGRPPLTVSGICAACN